MDVSALLTSVGINIGLCILYFTLYSILRKQPSNVDVYAPRLLAEGKLKQRSHFNLDRLLPSPGWVRTAWQPSEEELLSSSGLDVVVFMRIFIFSLRVFSFAGIIGIFVLLPVNCLGDQLEDVDYSDFSSNSLDLFSISNVKNGSKMLWIHFSAVYVVTVFVCCLLYYEYRYISSKRIAYFYSSKPQPHQFTILVRNIPVSAGSSVSDSVDSFFSECYPSTYLSNVVVRRTKKLQSLIKDAKKLYKRLVHLQSEPTQKKFQRDCCFGLFGRKVDLVDHYEKKLEDLEENVRLERSEVSSQGEEIRAAFVSFKSRYSAAAALHLQQSVNPTLWVTEQAPEPHDVYWPFFSSSFIRRWIYKLVVIVACTLLTIVFIIPVVIVQGLTNLAQLEVWFPFLKGILAIKFVSQVITGYLPSLILQLFLKIVPPIMKFLSSIQGYISNSKIGKSACNKVLWFTIWNIFFANVLSGSVLNQISIFLDPKTIPAKLAVAVPAQFLNVYAPKYETGGKFWPIVHNSTIFSLVLMHAIALGIFTLKKLPLATDLIVPLPVLTLLFNEYCRKRFLPIFIAYPAECLTKKDREDQDDDTMNEFFDKLAIAYKDPSLFPFQHSASTESHSSPLLSSAEV
ncbi:CSC1-like protein At1g69450 isoform X2 [Malania oleifera]|uniref:CSC1-like protein At1g69450 isoform X2 n=1 Tax=Malania oleifera TaxID=397392 RepID=UPI0025AE9EE6|nr:CSC1-like protein At1g69450 isoform X2 [Malania oleifera]